jgi:hypothetical protein
METVIILSVVGILLVGCWHVGNVSQKHWKQLEADPEPEAFANPIEPSEVGGDLITDAIIGHLTT